MCVNKYINLQNKLYICVCVCVKSSDAKASINAIWNLLFKWAILSGSYIYVQLFYLIA